RAGYSTSLALHAGVAVVAASMMLAHVVHVPVVRARSSVVMPAIVAASPTSDVLRAPSRAREPKPASSSEGARGFSRAVTPQPTDQQPLPPAREVPAPIDAPSSIAPETVAAGATDGATDAIPGGVPGGGIEATSGSGSGSGIESRGPYRVGGSGGIKP